MIVEEKTIYSSFVTKRKKPVNLFEDKIFLFKNEFTYAVPATYFKRINKVDVLNDTVFDPSSFKFFAAETHINGVFTLKQKIIYLFCYSHPRRKLEKGVWITQNWTWMYFHWLTDALTRLIACDQFIDDHMVVLPQSYKKYPFIRESLEYLGYKIHWVLLNECLRINELILPSHTASPGNFNDIILKKLRSKFCLSVTPPSKNIYISRAKASQRFIDNEQELINLLLDYNFEIHVFEEYSFLKQVELMNQTTLLIGLHGAGLANMLFMQNKAKVIEIRNQNDSKNNCYFSMASALELSYYFVEGTGNGGNTSDAIVKVNIESVNILFQQMGLKSESKRQ